jgi:hypothetical protein
MSRRAYQCLCGMPIVVEETVEDLVDPSAIGWSVKLDHRAPMDAACRLVVELLRDELLAIQHAGMQRIFLRPAALV